MNYILYVNGTLQTRRIIKEKQMITENQRNSVAQTYFQGAQQIVERSKNDKLCEIFDFLCITSCLIIPDGLGGFVSGRALKSNFAGIKNSRWLWLYVFDRGDLPHLPENCIRCLNLHDDNNMAGYFHENLFLKLRADRGPFSMFFKGYLLLHEGRHACTQQIESISGRAVLHEYQTLCFDHEWISAYGGKQYSELLNRWVMECRANLTERLTGINAVPEPKYPHGLDDIMGRSGSRMETQIRKSILYRHTLFTLVQEKWASETEQAERLSCFM